MNLLVNCYCATCTVFSNIESLAHMKQICCSTGMFVILSALVWPMSVAGWLCFLCIFNCYQPEKKQVLNHKSFHHRLTRNLAQEYLAA